MTVERLQQILDQFARARVLVAGDFFLDKYLVIDAGLTERSIETGLPAYQVVEKRVWPGGAGAVSANLRVLGTGTVQALGLVGRDGEGYELRMGLEALGIDTSLLVETDACFTPTYTKPVWREAGTEREMNRLDIRSRHPCPPDVEQRVLLQLRESVATAHAIVVVDQVPERNRGVITDAVRAVLTELARAHPDTVFIADSRMRAGEYPGLSVKPNRAEAIRTVFGERRAEPTFEEVLAAGRELQARSGRPTFITLAEDGLLIFDGKRVWHAPALRQTGPVDPCGAGDSVMAGIALALCSGASALEAGIVGNVVASITVQQIGVTGTASRDEVLERFRAAGDAFLPRPVDG